jgi:hypothetical protein
MRVSSANAARDEPNIFKALYDEAGHKQAAKSFFYWIPVDCEGRDTTTKGPF